MILVDHHGTVENLKRVALEQENKVKFRQERLLMAFTSCVDNHCCINLVSLIAVFLARTVTFARVAKFKLIAFLGNYSHYSLRECEGVAMGD